MAAKKTVVDSENVIGKLDSVELEKGRVEGTFNESLRIKGLAYEKHIATPISIFSVLMAIKWKGKN